MENVDIATLPTARYRAIRTRFVGPTNTRDSRIIADAGDRQSRVIWHVDHRLNSEQNHAAAAVAVTQKMGWTGEYFTPLVGGEIDNMYVWVFLPKPEPKHPGLTCQYCGTADVCCEHCYHNKPEASNG